MASLSVQITGKDVSAQIRLSFLNAGLQHADVSGVNDSLHGSVSQTWESGKSSEADCDDTLKSQSTPADISDPPAAPNTCGGVTSSPPGGFLPVHPDWVVAAPRRGALFPLGAGDDCLPAAVRASATKLGSCKSTGLDASERLRRAFSLCSFYFVA